MAGFIVSFGVTPHSPEVLNKTYSETKTKSITEASGPIDILKMTLILKYDSDIINTNYAYIAEFNRYYFVKWTLETDERMIAHLEVDPLKSWESNIMNITSIIVRSGIYTHPTFVEDELIPFDSRERISIISASTSIHEDSGNVADTLMIHTI